MPLPGLRTGAAAGPASSPLLRYVVSPVHPSRSPPYLPSLQSEPALDQNRVRRCDAILHESASAMPASGKGGKPGGARENLAMMKYLKKMHSRVIFLGRLDQVVRGITTAEAAYFSVKLYMDSRSSMSSRPR
ncbi:hypothetical protein PR202_gb06008 [Eleusine coracana subsp. coracana]|uniref:Uncharacterized protein n=1 Tax=Eleusine coracana subsp. coracana TaxID=191504 RepID=A0AAV5E8G3_ELECO|nr:hypothetical protein PR202_gb06008 [Eleusine coracana subsp. coracana]